jgi:hypothetical protein
LHGRAGARDDAARAAEAEHFGVQALGLKQRTLGRPTPALDRVKLQLTRDLVQRLGVLPRRLFVGIWRVAQLDQTRPTEPDAAPDVRLELQQVPRAVDQRGPHRIAGIKPAFDDRGRRRRALFERSRFEQHHRVPQGIRPARQLIGCHGPHDVAPDDDDSCAHACHGSANAKGLGKCRPRRGGSGE